MIKVLIILLLYFLGVQSTPSVIVIGAGPAGIAAATRLLENKVNVTVLEAEPRIGGRVKSVFFGNAYVDLGAEWCHGEKGNIVYELVKDLNILQHSNFHYQFYSSDKKNVDERFSLELHELFDTLYTPGSDKQQPEGITLGEYFIRKYNATVQNRYRNDSEKLNFCIDALECFNHYLLSAEGAFSWFDTSATNDYRDCEGDLNLNWNGLGYKTILEILMKKYPKRDSNFPIDEAIHTNKEVKKIVWDQISNVSVTCTDGSVYTAQHVIFTPSVGVLKNRHRTLFSPPLPPKKAKAIRNIGIGAVMKVIIEFPNRWWDEDTFTGFSFVWQLEHKEMLAAEFPYGPIQNGRSWLLDLFGLYPVEKNPNVLSAWFTGELVDEIEKTPNKIVVDGILFVLDRFLGHKYNISNPRQILRTDWYANPHFRGTYSFQTVESRKVKPSSNLVLAEALLNSVGSPSVLFAGEATHPYFYSTVHGAIETGYREAERLLTYFSRKSTYGL